MKSYVISLVALVIILTLGCGKKQDAIVNSDNSVPEVNNPPTEVVRLLENYSDGHESDIAEILAASSGNDNINDSIYDVYIVTFLWGRILNTAPIADAAFYWDGSLSVNGPSIVQALSTIDFERGEDSLVPDNSTSSESWGSFTDNEFDGIVFLVLYDKVTPTFAVQMLTFETPPITLQFDFSQLVHLTAYYEVHPAYGVAVAARKIRPTICREGYFAGNWIKDSSWAFSGTFNGYWFSHDNDTVGTVNGTFFKTNDGQQLLQGQVSGLYTDQIIAVLHGVWEYDDFRMCPLCGFGHGNFKGRFELTNSGEGGYFRGEFGDYALPPDDLEMPFHALWRMNCVTLAHADFPSSD
jgi:hypothetical protein